jgi:hypothetical protein
VVLPLLHVPLLHVLLLVHGVAWVKMLSVLPLLHVLLGVLSVLLLEHMQHHAIVAHKHASNSGNMHMQ